MQVASLRVRNLRILRDIEVEFASSVNLVLGPNGSGKTSLLEAVHILGSGRSFRSYRLHDVVTRSESSLSVVGRTVGCDGSTVTIGVDYSSEAGIRIRRGGGNVKAASELAASLPMVTVTPDTYRLVTDGADLRRRMIDKLLFHVEPGYLDCFQRYRRALRQRNAAIRDGATVAELAGWDGELAISGERLTAQRAVYLERALPVMTAAVRKLVGGDVDIQFRQGWNRSVSLEGAYRQTVTSDRQKGYTQAGPHRADLRFSIDGRPVQHCLSRGEIKMFVTAVSVAQARDLAEVRGFPPLVLVDDLASELDSCSRRRCLAELKAIGAQLFVTAVPGHGLNAEEVEDARVFHVEHGQITEVV